MNIQMLFSRNRSPLYQWLVAFHASALFFAFASPGLAATDVYVVFASESSQLKKELSTPLKKVMHVKTYNVAMLALADYSGKQKVIAKFSRANVVVILGDKPLEALSGSTFASHLIVVSNADNDLSSEKIKVYVVPKGSHLSAIGSRNNWIGISTESALGGDVKSGNVYVITPPLAIDRAIAKLVKSLIGK